MRQTRRIHQTVRTALWTGARVLAPGVLAFVVTGCAPAIQSSLRHPDSDKQIVFKATKGNITTPISQMRITTGGSTVATVPGNLATYTGGPFVTYSNLQLPFCAIARSSGRNYAKCDWIYVANPKNNFTYPTPNGGNNGYPDASSEQTGANLYRNDKTVVRDRALDAVAEYVNWRNAQHPSPADDITVIEASNVADHLVAAVAYYVDAHMSWRDDATNETVFANNGWASYNPGWDFPQPADLTLTISGDLTNAAANDDYQGDCEDHAILRAALLRALGFAPWGIWDAIDNPISHEYNIVLYEGAYRLMDYGTIDRWLDTHTWDAHRSYYGWNETNGPRGVAASNHNFLVTLVDNYPGGKDDGNPWSFMVYYRDTSP